jgi:hypothetical protein
MRLIGKGDEVELATMVTASQIRERLLDLLASDQPEAVDDFDEWIVAASWNMHKDSEIRARRLVSAIELRLAEFDSGQIKEEDLRKQLKEIMLSHLISIPESPVVVSSGSSADFTHQVWAFSSADMSPLMAFGSLAPR